MDSLRENHMNRSVIAYLNEARTGGTTAGVLTGLGGLYTGGGITGHWQSHKLQQAEREKARREGNLDFVKTDKIGRHLGYGLLGSIPLVGSVSNAIIAKKRYDLEEKLKAADTEKEKRELIEKAKKELRDEAKKGKK